MNFFDPPNFTDWDENNLIRIDLNQPEERILKLKQMNLETNRELIDWAEQEILAIQKALSAEKPLPALEKHILESQLLYCKESITAAEASIQRIKDSFQTDRISFQFKRL